MLLNRPQPGPGIQAESLSGFRTKSAIVSPSSGNFPMRNTYISAISYSTATSFRFLSPLSPEISISADGQQHYPCLSGLTPFLFEPQCIEQQRRIWEQVSELSQIVFTVTQQKNKLESVQWKKQRKKKCYKKTNIINNFSRSQVFVAHSF